MTAPPIFFFYKNQPHPLQVMASSDLSSGTAGGPRDAAVMEAILKEMGVVDYEPNVIHQMLEFSYRK